MTDETANILFTDRMALVASLGAVIDDMPTGVAVFGPDMRLRHCNRTWRRMTEDRDGTPADVVAGMLLTECVPGVEEWLPAFDTELMAGRTVVREGLPLTANGTTTYWDVTIAPIVGDGKVKGFVQAVVDANERVRVHKELEQRVEERTAELERRREVADSLHEVLRILNSCCPTDEVLDYIISQARHLLGASAAGVYSLARTEGQGILTATSHGIPDDLLLDIVFPTNEGFVAATIMQGAPLVCPDSAMLFGPITERMQPEHRDRIHRIFTHYHALLAVPLKINNVVWGALGLYFLEPRPFSAEEVSLASDLGDHLALAIENAQLRENAEEAATTAERNRLARDLHDAVTQTLFSASLIAEVLPRLWERDQEAGMRRLEQLRHLTRGALAEMRTLLLELRPAALVDAELGDVLRQLAEAKAATGIAVDVFVEGTPRRLTPELQIALYRTAQEALNNIAKHADASRAEIALRYLPSAVEISIDDNGSGFDPGLVTGDHFGLDIMRERAESVGGTFGVESTPGVGTCVSVLVSTIEDKECGCPPRSE